MFSTCKQQCFKVINIPTKQKTRLVSIWVVKIPKFCFAMKATLGN